LIVVVDGVVRLQLNCKSEHLSRFFKLFVLVQRQPQTVMCFGVVPGDIDRFLQVGDAVVKVLYLAVAVSAVEVGTEELGT